MTELVVVLPLLTATATALSVTALHRRVRPRMSAALSTVWILGVAVAVVPTLVVLRSCVVYDVMSYSMSGGPAAVVASLSLGVVAGGDGTDKASPDTTAVALGGGMRARAATGHQLLTSR